MPVKTNAVTLALIEEASPGVLPGSPQFEYLEPNDINAFGATITKIARNPISLDRAPRKGTPVDLDSVVDIAADLTMSQFLTLGQGFMFSTFTAVGDSAQSTFFPTAVVATGYTVPANGDINQSLLIFARGFTNPENNGLKVVDAASTTTEIKAPGLVVEGSPPVTARVDICGFRTAVGDLDVDASGNLTSTVLDFTTLGLTLGQSLFVGGEAVANQFTTAANYGAARVAIAPAAALLTLEKTQQAFVLEANTTQLVDLYFGPFLRDVDQADADFAERTFQVEAQYVGLTDASPQYAYSKSNQPNVVSMIMAGQDKATMGIAMIGTDTDNPTSIRAAAATFVDPIQTEAFNTSADFIRLRVQEADETGLFTLIKNATFTINNGITAEKVLATLGGIAMNFGDFVVTGNMEALFTSGLVIAAIRNNDTVGLDWLLRNGDGGILFDIPEMTLGNGGLSFPRNESVRIQIDSEQFGSSLGYSMGMTHFPFLPAISTAP